jgi:hypothetical protein
MTFLKQSKAHGEEREKEARIMGEQNKKKEVAFSKSSLLGGRKLQLHTVICKIYLKYHVLYV